MKAQRTRWHGDESGVITSPYVVKSRNLSFLLRQAISSLTAEYQEEFNPVTAFAVRSIYRINREGDQTEVYETMGPGMLLASFRSGSLGLSCTALLEMILTYGNPTLLYKDVREDYSDITAEWYDERIVSEYPKVVAKRLRLHSTGTLHMREIEQQAERYLLRGNNESRPLEHTSWHELAVEEADEKLDELNRRLEERGYRTRFRVALDEFGWDVVVDDGGKPELVETVEQAETIVEELCSIR